MSKPEIALQMYTMREVMKTPEDREKTLAEIARIGYKNVELAGTWGLTPAEAKALLSRHGLKVISMHIGLPQVREGMAETLAAMKVFGCMASGLGAMPGDYRNEAGMKKLVVELGEALATYKQNGFTLSYHNHKFEFEKFGGKNMLEHLFEGLPGLSPQFDVAWVQAGGGNPAAWIRRYKDRLFTIHFKDFTIKADQLTLCEVGEGSLDWTEIAKAASESSARYVVVEQDVSTDPLASIAISFKKVKSLGFN
ncbi:MAG: sugar phosphate isomerase/epimerase [Spirochaetes bacterium]|nr:sugar phosphate isomerase/epimerase [Spirochaetota bacterium]